MKLLIGGMPSKIFHMKEFSESLNNYGIETKFVLDSDIYDGFPSRKIHHWFQSRKKFNKLIKEFKPDVILINRFRHFGLASIKTNLPMVVHLHGDFWAEIKWYKQTIYRPFYKRIALWQWNKIASKCFDNATMIMPICKYLEKIVKEHYPIQKTQILYLGIKSSDWYPSDEMTLKHPCVGLLQNANIWGKVKEMLILPKILEAMPDVMFYWAGDGPYKNEILKILKKYDNFKWLGSLDYPNQVRDFLSEIDVYALLSGIDMAPSTLLEAQLMKKPVVATNVGGIFELMEDNVTGYLIEKGDHHSWIEKLSLLLENQTKSEQMGSLGRNFVIKNFSWDKIVKDFVNILNQLK